MKHIALLGAGSHSRNEHIPALEYLLQERKDFRVTAVCDLNHSLASEAASKLGADQVLTDLDALLETPGLDGIISVTPTPLTCELTSRILDAGIPVLMEKPLGASMREADQVVAKAAATGTPVMVGMNRRHDPVIAQIRSWCQERTLTYARAVIRRQNRREVGFIEDAALHPIDLLCGFLGAGTVERVFPIGPDCGEAGVANLRFGTVQVVVEILPACGAWEESYQFCGDGFSIHALPQKEASLRENRARHHFTAPEGVEGGWTTGETIAFLNALNGEAPWTPTPAEVRDSMKLTQTISEQVRQGMTP